MELIEALEYFRTKPINANLDKMRLMERNPEKPSTETPGASVYSSGSPEDLQLTLTPSTSPYYLPEEYAPYSSVLAEFDNAAITNPNARAAILAQLGLETGWNANPTDYNYGNITKGDSWTGPTYKHGDKDAEGNPITHEFRSYKSDSEFVKDYLKLLKTLYPEAYNQLTGDEFNIDKFVSGLVDGKFRYAVDPQYKEKLKSVYSDVLKNFDKANS